MIAGRNPQRPAAATLGAEPCSCWPVLSGRVASGWPAPTAAGAPSRSQEPWGRRGRGLWCCQAPGWRLRPRVGPAPFSGGEYLRRVLYPRCHLNKNNFPGLPGAKIQASGQKQVTQHRALIAARELSIWRSGSALRGASGHPSPRRLREPAAARASAPSLQHPHRTAAGPTQRCRDRGPPRLCGDHC